VLKFGSTNTAHAPGRVNCYAAGERVPVDGVIPAVLAELMYLGDGRSRRILRMVYECGLFQALRDRLRCKEIWVIGAASAQCRYLAVDACWQAARIIADATFASRQAALWARERPRSRRTARTSPRSTRTSSPSGTPPYRRQLGVLIYFGGRHSKGRWPCTAS
jgi:hypothetical protein